MNAPEVLKPSRAALAVTHEVINVGTVQPLEELPGVLDERVGPGTANFACEPAMTSEQLQEALLVGHDAAERAAIGGAQLFIGGEMGIGNTTSAAALCAALFGGPAAQWVGRGSGVDDSGLARKVAAVEAGLALHGPALSDPLEALRRLGGREIAAAAGAIIAARHQRVPVILDGYVVTAAAAVLHALSPGALDHCLAGHVSAEAPHRAALERLGLAPVLDLGLRLGEGSGAALAAAMVKAAAACHSGMATFLQAGVSGPVATALPA